jgi:preprotein translocase subunit SecA
MLYFFGKAFKAMIAFVKQYVVSCCCRKRAYEQHEDEPDKEEEEEEPTYSQALQERQRQADNPDREQNKLCIALSGAETYRLPHHPRYSEIFTSPFFTLPSHDGHVC